VDSLGTLLLKLLRPVFHHSRPTGITGDTTGMAKVMVSLPDDLLRAVDVEAVRRGTTRSGYCVNWRRTPCDDAAFVVPNEWWTSTKWADHSWATGVGSPKWSRRHDPSVEPLAPRR
jgi:hypothetical protein